MNLNLKVFKKKTNYCSIVIFFSLCLSLFYANHNIKLFDKNILNENNKSVHLMIKNDPLRYFSHGYEIKEEIKKGVNYFDTGRENFTKYLYPRIIAAYYLIFDYHLYENSQKKIIKEGIHFKFLVFQILFYYLSLLFLNFQLKNKIENLPLFFTTLFLCIEPTLFQYHGSFWSESIFFSLQILIMGIIISDSYSNKKIFFIGVLLSLLFFQRSNGLYYMLPIIIYFFLVKNAYLKIYTYLIFGFIMFPLIVGYHNYKSSGKFYIVPLETKSVLHAYVIPNILSEKELNFEKEKFFKLIENKNILLGSHNLLDFNYSRYSFIFCENVDKQSDNREICDYFQKRAKEIIISNPIKFVIYVLKKSVSFSILNPFHIYSDHKFLSGDEYYKSELHSKLVPYRIVYSLIIYLVCLLGLMQLIKQKKYNLLIYIIISSLYFFMILSWHGNNRYFTPVLIYLSVLFGYGISFATNYLNFKKLIR